MECAAREFLRISSVSVALSQFGVCRKKKSKTKQTKQNVAAVFLTSAFSSAVSFFSVFFVLLFLRNENSILPSLFCLFFVVGGPPYFCTYEISFSARASNIISNCNNYNNPAPRPPPNSRQFFFFVRRFLRSVPCPMSAPSNNNILFIFFPSNAASSIDSFLIFVVVAPSGTVFWKWSSWPPDWPLMGREPIRGR